MDSLIYIDDNELDKLSDDTVLSDYLVDESTHATLDNQFLLDVLLPYTSKKTHYILVKIFWENLGISELANELFISQESAQKEVLAALEELRRIMYIYLKKEDVE